MGKEAKYIVRLSNEERGQLEDLVARGRVAKATRQRAQVLLRADQGQEGPGSVDEAIANLVGVSLSTVHRVRQQCVEEGLEASLYRKPATNRQYRKLVELEIAESIGREAVRTTLKKTFFSPGAKSNGCCRPSKTPILSARWKTSSKSTNGPTIRGGRSCVLTSKAGN